MPLSNPKQISAITDQICRMSPTSVLDLGCGCGTFGFMTRVFWDLDLTKPWEQSSRHTKIVAVEGFEGYITAIHQAIYDEIYVENVLDFLERIQDTGTRYDLVLLLDILEHFMKEEGQRVLQLIDNISKHRIVSTPVNFYAQGAVMGNELERHLSLWKPNEIGGKEIYRDGITFVCAK